MRGQTLLSQGAINRMAVEKKDCVTIDQAAKEIGKSKATVYTYMNILNIQRFRFTLDRRTYILASDVRRIQQYLSEHA